MVQYIIGSEVPPGTCVTISKPCHPVTRSREAGGLPDASMAKIDAHRAPSSCCFYAFFGGIAFISPTYSAADNPNPMNHA